MDVILGNNRQLGRMAWPDAQKELESGSVVIIPIGSVEQHGPHMPLGTDFYIADKLGKMVAERCENCLVAPTIPYGFAEYHSDFGGTASVERQETLKAYIEEIVNHFALHGTTHVLFINSHGGNMGVLDYLCHDLRKRGVLAATVLWWDVISRKDPARSPAGHGDWIEISLMLAMDESTVDMTKAKNPVAKSLNHDKVTLVTPHELEYDGVPIHIRLRTKDFSDTGDMPEPGLTPEGDPNVPVSEGNADLGNELYELVTSFIVDFVPEFAEIEL